MQNKDILESSLVLFLVSRTKYSFVNPMLQQMIRSLTVGCKGLMLLLLGDHHRPLI